jgi:protein-disulfide isomerase
MTHRSPGFALLGLTLVAAALAPAATPAAAAPATAAAHLAAYAAQFLPFDPETRISFEPASEKLPGFQAFRLKRTGRYSKLNVDRVVYVSSDNRWFFGGDALQIAGAHPVRTNADLDFLNARFADLFRTRVRVTLAPERDAAGLKALAVAVESGYGAMRIPGYITPDGKTYLQGTLWDFQKDPRAERRARIDLSASRASGDAGARVNIVEYADMECGYCKFRGLQMDRLLEANAGIVHARRHYKFFPLFMGHVWSMKAASAGDCISLLASPAALFRFKQQVYSQQDTMTVSGIDELAVTTAEADGIRSADFLSCYLQPDSVERVRHDIEEGYRLGVNSTPTYFVDGTEISWTEDKVMEDFLRTLFPKVKTISYSK